MNTLFTKSLIEGKKKHGVALIAEIKKASPSHGSFLHDHAGPAPGFRPVSAPHAASALPGALPRRQAGLPPVSPASSFNCENQARIYESSGAAAISVLTEPKRFNGSLEDLRMVSQSVSIPTLRKDFITHKSQIDEARQCGAAAILLIVRNLTDEQLKTLYVYATEVGLSVLVETHTEEEIGRAVAVGATIIGVNARNLETLQIDTKVFETLLPLIPDNCIKVAESGIHTRHDVESAVRFGADAVLVGSAIMKSANPEEKIRELLNIKISSSCMRGSSL